MLKLLGKFIGAVICVAACVCIVLMILMCIFTPHKTKYGHFTDPYKYWTSEAYICQNFDVKCENNKIVEKQKGV